jgi:hypothetical protein
LRSRESNFSPRDSNIVGGTAVSKEGGTLLEVYQGVKKRSGKARRR